MLYCRPHPQRVCVFEYLSRIITIPDQKENINNFISTNTYYDQNWGIVTVGHLLLCFDHHHQQQ